MTKYTQETTYEDERVWLNRAFMARPIGDSEEQDRHPGATHFTIRHDKPVRYAPIFEESHGSQVYGWVDEQISSKKPAKEELQAGDTSMLDSFLAGFTVK